jgi:hypothetical protein
LDAVSKVKPVAFASVAGGGATAMTDGFDLTSTLPPQTDVILLAALVLWAGYLAWQYRDVIAVKVQSWFPKIANILRSI